MKEWKRWVPSAKRRRSCASSSKRIGGGKGAYTSMEARLVRFSLRAGSGSSREVHDPEGAGFLGARVQAT